MDQVCAVFPVLPGKSGAARDFMRQLDTERKGEFDRSERRIGITKEVWFLAQGAGGDQLVGYMETKDFKNAIGMFSQSQDAFDLWFKRRFAEVTGVDFNNLPPDMKLPELLSSYQA